ncbi:MAG: dephospho-CoA kinase [Thermodesulfovibrionales bacterium]|nr:dephospho-CoA kinase [Thermodesulfovibrionales bacterium]MDP3111902.1 dephospho-CoA kinase [Thermodesulfovibrionales bacterium]
MYNNLMFIAGLTGNYGMGKSAVLSMFRELGAVTIDADWIVRMLLRKKDVLKKVKALFGSGVFGKNNRLDKKKIAERIFRNKSLRIKLEDVLHPLVFERVDDFVRKFGNGNKVIIVEAPLIFERGHEGRFDRTITVFTNETTAINRLSMHGITAKQASERLKCQLPIKEKIKRSDYSIDNSGEIEKTRKQVEAVYKELLREAKIKELLSAGKIGEVKKLTGKPYFIGGKVIRGAGRGRKLLNIPTANISVQKGTPLKEGVYAVKVIVPPTHPSPASRYDSQPRGEGKKGGNIFEGVANIGKNPTFGIMPVSYEVHIFDFSGNLLGKKLQVDFIKRIRDEKKFPNVKALETQIKRDIKKAKEILKRL